MTAIALQSAAPRQSSVPSPDVRHTARCAPRRRRFRRWRLSSARASTGPVARDSRGWLRRLLALTTRPAVNCWCCERRRRVQRRSSSVLPARSGKSSAAVPRPSPSRAAAQKRCAPHAPHSCVSDVFHAIVITRVLRRLPPPGLLLPTLPLRPRDVKRFSVNSPCAHARLANVAHAKRTTPRTLCVLLSKKFCYSEVFFAHSHI